MSDEQILEALQMHQAKNDIIYDMYVDREPDSYIDACHILKHSIGQLICMCMYMCLDS